MAVSLNFRKFDTMFKKMLCLVGLFAGCGLVGSQDDNSEVREIELAVVVQDDVLDHQEYGPRFNYREFSFPSARYSAMEMPDVSSDDCKVCVGCVGVAGVIATIITVSVLYGSAETYRVYNQESYPIDVHYQPGCKNNRDCVQIVYPGDHAVIYNLGRLTRLCVYKSWGEFGHYGCVTQKSLKDTTWYVHDNLVLSRTDGDRSSTNVTTTNEAAVEDFRSYRNNNSKPEYVSNLSENALASHHNLRGLIDLEK